MNKAFSKSISSSLSHSQKSPKSAAKSKSVPDLSSKSSKKRISITLVKSKEALDISDTKNPVYKLFYTLSEILDENDLVMDDSMTQKQDGLLVKNISDISLKDDEIHASPRESLISMKLSKECKLKIMRQLLDLKRILDKEGGFIASGTFCITSESLLQKRIFSKNLINISVLIRTLKVIKIENRHGLKMIVLK